MPLLFSKRLLFLVALASIFCFAGCSPKLSKNFAYNHYQRNFKIQVLNDSLQMQLSSPADIKYATNLKSFKVAWQKSQLKSANEVLLLGTTDTPPYEFAVTVGKQKELAQKGDYKVLDTMFNGTTIHFIARTDSAKAVDPMQTDLKNMFKSLKLGDTYRDGISSVMDLVSASMNNNQFYKTLNEIQQFPLPKNQGNSLELQMQLTFASFLAPNKNYDDLLARQEASFKPNDTILNDIKTKGLTDLMAFNGILEQAGKTQVLMLNENHYYPQHRLLVTELLPKLKAMGYNYLAMEALATPNDSLLNVPGAFPTLSTGFYTREQNYGNLLREAISKGFKLVAYENTDDKQDREVGQATNLYNRTLAIDPKAKILVLVGIDHLLEQPTANGKKWMATVFKEKYKIDPVTISQTHLNLYRKLVPATHTFLAKTDLGDQKKYGSVDFYLINNQTKALTSQSVKYKNTWGTTVQVSLFYQKELKTVLDFNQNIPYYAKLLKANETVNLPIYTNESALLVVYDELGYILEKKNISSR